PVQSVNPPVHGTYPNALAVSPDGSRVYVAEAGVNAIAVLDTTKPTQPQLIGHYPTGWYPSAPALDPIHQVLYVVNAKGVGEDLGRGTGSTPPATTLNGAVPTNIDSNFIFGTVQQIDLSQAPSPSVGDNNFSVGGSLDTSIVPIGGAPSAKIKHVF